MLTLAWNPRGSHLIKLSTNVASSTLAEIFEPLPQWRSIEAASNERKLLAPADNAHPHIAKLSTQYFNEN
jgi:hypothetical protein